MMAQPSHGLALLMFAVPLVGWIIARLIVNYTGSVVKALGDQPLAEWHGVYYAFNQQQVRIYEDDDCLWFVAIDVARAVGWKTLPQSFLVAHASRLKLVPGTPLKALDLQSLELLLGKRRDRECGRFLQWARLEVQKPWLKKRADRSIASPKLS